MDMEEKWKEMGPWDLPREILSEGHALLNVGYTLLKIKLKLLASIIFVQRRF